MTFLQDQLGRAMQLLQQQLPADQMSTSCATWSAPSSARRCRWLASLFQSLITSSFAILNIVSLVVVTPIVTFLLLRDWEKMVAQIDSLPAAPVARHGARAGADRQRHAGRLHPRPGARLPDPGDLLRHRR